VSGAEAATNALLNIQDEDLGAAIEAATSLREVIG
jgi:hypothetical protein